ncbi:DUF3592 domain-containing protein [Pelagibaculum spongiae]|uniref:DUF3592 domain-containing protein n=1 Tax=Pelagibaculum spongiae TaxID=2080658 RepID=A0A2V1GQ20_9GAMM|nr:DUF3592 domain-containing protein [Pelagibaculum spongiae]PVZ65446.1 hypothetical protein DC094_18365 [Pelagibaculum spongiae]
MWKLLFINSGFISLLILTYSSWFQIPYQHLQQADSNKYWRVVSGKVINSHVEEQSVFLIDFLQLPILKNILPPQLGKLTMTGDVPALKIQFKVDGKEYIAQDPWLGSNQLSLHNLFGPSLKFIDIFQQQPLKQYVAERYPAGKATMVYYDPRNPSRSLVEPGMKLHSRLKLWGYLALCLTTTILLLATLKHSFYNRRSSPQHGRRHSLLN